MEGEGKKKEKKKERCRASDNKNDVVYNGTTAHFFLKNIKTEREKRNPITAHSELLKVIIMQVALRHEPRV